MKSMNVLMPIFMLWTTFSLPAAMGLYWIVGNIMMILQSVVIYFIFTKKMEALSATDSRRRQRTSKRPCLKSGILQEETFMAVSIEKTGKTVQHAINDALEALGLTADEVVIEVLDEGDSGLLGMAGGRRRSE